MRLHEHDLSDREESGSYKSTGVGFVWLVVRYLQIACVVVSVCAVCVCRV